MSNLIPSDHQAQAHDIPKGKHVAAHLIVVEGFYLSAADEAHNGHHERKRVAYSETFELDPSAKALAESGALSHILSDKLLIERLRSKDKNFRAIATHTITRHENVLVDAPAAAETDSAIGGTDNSEAATLPKIKTKK